MEYVVKIIIFGFLLSVPALAQQYYVPGSGVKSWEPVITPGTSSQYWRGDKTWQTFPTFGVGTVTSVGITSTDLAITGSPILVSGSITLNLNPSGISAGIYRNLVVNSKGIATAGSQYAESSVTRALNTVFRPSATQNYFVSYSIDIAATLTLTGGASGQAILEIATDSGFTTGVRTIDTAVNGNTGGLTVGLSLTQTGTVKVQGTIPAGYYVRIRTNNLSGTPVYTYRSGQETLY